MTEYEIELQPLMAQERIRQDSPLFVDIHVRLGAGKVREALGELA